MANSIVSMAATNRIAFQHAQRISSRVIMVNVYRILGSATEKMTASMKATKLSPSVCSESVLLVNSGAI